MAKLHILLRTAKRERFSPTSTERSRGFLVQSLHLFGKNPRLFTVSPHEWRGAPRQSFFFTPFLLSFRRTLEGAFVVSRSDLPFFVGARGKLGVALACGRPTLGAASPMKPRGSFSFDCSYVILPAFSLSARGRGRSVRRAEGNGGASSGNARKSFAMLPDARLEKGTKRWDDEGFYFENRRSARESPPLFCMNSRGR